MSERWPQILRHGALVRVAPLPTQGRGIGAHALAYVDLRFKDGHVERWLHSGGTRQRERGLDVPLLLVEWGRNVVEEQADSLLWELGDSFYPYKGKRRGGIDFGPLEVVVEWNVDLDDPDRD